jgi:Amt family ammonium transporter
MKMPRCLASAKTPSFVIVFIACLVVAFATHLLLPQRGFAQTGQPPSAEVTAVAEEARLAINLMWMLITGFLVFFMQLGFALVEAGFTRAKSVVHTMMMNLVVFCIAALGYWAVGFAFQFGAVNVEWPGVTTLGAVPGPWSHAPTSLGDWGGNLAQPLLKLGEQASLIGGTGFGLTGLTLSSGVLTFFLFQLVFMNTSATIPTGAMAERLKFGGFCLMALFISMFIYPIVGSWIWGGGWLQNLGRIAGFGNGAVDFAGSGVVHMVGGTVALAGAIALGPRQGRFNEDGSVNPMPGHNIPLGIMGTIVLFFGWFAFNAGSAYGVTGAVGQLAANAAVNTLVSGAAGGVSAMLYAWFASPLKKPDASMTVNGVLSGLVSITASCAFVESGSAVLIGLIAGVLCCLATSGLERLQIDDPVGAVPVHLVNGVWGLLAVGLFGAGLPITRGWNGMDRPVTGLLFGNTGQLTAQLIEAAAIFFPVFVVSWIFFLILKGADFLRTSSYHENMGLDLAEMGVAGYNDDGSINLDSPVSAPNAAEPSASQQVDPWGAPARGPLPRPDMRPNRERFARTTDADTQGETA